MERHIGRAETGIETKQITIPSPKECLYLLKKYEVYPHIIIHSKQVAQIAMFLAKELKKQKIALNLRLVEAGALLHDIAKTYSIEHPGIQHTVKGAEWLERLGYYKVADIVRCHVDLPEELSIDEKTIVNYADKRVKHDIIVSVEERFEDLFKRYGQTEEKYRYLKQLYKRSKRLESLIFSYLPFEPEFINNL